MFIISEPEVARVHAILEYKNGQFVVYNKGQVGTRVNGIIVNSQVLNSGDTIGVGSVDLRLEY